MSHLPSWLGTEDSPRTPGSSRQTGTAGLPCSRSGRAGKEPGQTQGRPPAGGWGGGTRVLTSVPALRVCGPGSLPTSADAARTSSLVPDSHLQGSGLRALYLALRMHPFPDCGRCSPDCQAEEAQPAPSCLPPRACPRHGLRGHQRKHRPFVRAGLLCPLAVTTSLLSWLFILFERRTSSKSQESHTVLHQQRSDWIQPKPRGPIWNAFCFSFSLDFTWIWRVKGLQGLK